MRAHLKIARQGRSPHLRGRTGLPPGLPGCHRSRKQLRDEGITYGLALHRHVRRSPTNHIADARSRPAIEYVHHQLACRELTCWYRRAGVGVGPNCRSLASRRAIHHSAELARSFAGRRDEARRVSGVVDSQDVIAIGTAVGTVCGWNAPAVVRSPPPATRGSRKHLMMMVAMASSAASSGIIAEVMVLGQMHV